MTTTKDALDAVETLFHYAKENLTEQTARRLAETIRNALQTQAEWQPIETAPRDGTSILLYGGDWVFEAQWRDNKWYTAYPNGDEPTQWRPLQEPPQKGERAWTTN